ncbi:ABC transporter permease [Virgibacillus sp. 179-BFC.A HS]|uniref:ABC transporter permease n=1 Tax=Tigheibacillus jepli TaxID=3035914 RepID=A0ABU5CGI7_9BACI|nr:ABC transporter permease [Virgibacillus sp. 179-BFC.A HS]MDY0405391.1 ABC transporter permease [Virgibacillus sp. 179-BFC.A HS]
MRFIRHIGLFTVNNFKQVRRKWLSLPLLLLFPILLIFLVVVIAAALFTQDETGSINVGLVDLDQSTETKMIVKLITESSQLGNYLQVDTMEENAAKKLVQKDQLGSYIVLPDGFTENLYQGVPVKIAIIGNPKQPTNSRLIKQLIDSVARHIATSQANILTIDHYAKNMGMSDQNRRALMFDQFKEFLLYVMGKDQVLDEEKIANHATSSPLKYFSIAGWFIVITLWTLLIFHSLYKQSGTKMNQRMYLYGISSIQQHIGRMIVTLCLVLACGMLALYGITHYVDLAIGFVDYRRIFIIALLYSISFLEMLAIIENVIRSEKLVLLTQYIATLLLLAASGAIIPAMYFSLKIQHDLAFVFGNSAFHWLEEIILNQRLYADYSLLAYTAFIGMLLLVASSVWKERMLR